jgi:hypothetical protein
MEKGSLAFFSFMIDITVGISQKVMMSEMHQYIEMQNEGMEVHQQLGYIHVL